MPEWKVAGWVTITDDLITTISQTEEKLEKILLDKNLSEEDRQWYERRLRQVRAAWRGFVEEGGRVDAERRQGELK